METQALPSIDTPTATRVAELFQALSDPSRVRILATLRDGEVNVGSLANAVGISESAVSHHLRNLRLLRLVRSRKEGRQVFYALDDDHIARVAPMDEQTLGLDLSTLLPGIDLQNDDCVNRLKTALQNVEGIHRAHQSDYDSTKEICLHFDPSVLSLHDVQSFAEEESAKLTKRFGHAVIPIEGMDCSDCAFVLKHTLEHMNGVMKLDVSFAEQQVRIEFDSQQIDQKSIENQIRRLGYSVPLSKLRRFIKQNQLLLLSSIAGLCIIVGWIGEISNYFSIGLSIGLYVVAYTLAGYPLALRSFRQIFTERRFNTDQLMLAAAFGAAILGEFAEGALLLFLFSLGHALEDRALDR